MPGVIPSAGPLGWCDRDALEVPVSQEPDGAEGLEWRPEWPGFDRYLEDTIVVDWQTPSVFECARGLGSEGAEESERVRAAFVFVRDRISQSLDVETDALPCSASQVLTAGTGLSYAKSHLLAALLRARGVPAGFAYQRISDPGATTGLALHGIVVAWLSSLEWWVPLDPRGNTELLRSEFRMDPPPSLAHPPDRGRGQVLFALIYARPLKRVVDLLDRGDGLSRVRRHLPADIGP